MLEILTCVCDSEAALSSSADDVISVSRKVKRRLCKCVIDLSVLELPDADFLPHSGSTTTPRERKLYDFLELI